MVATTQENRTQSALRVLGDRLEVVEAQLAACGNPSPRGNLSGKDGVELKEHMEVRLAALQEYVESRLCNIERNVGTAMTALDKRLDSMNEMRGAMKDQQAESAKRTEVEAIAKGLRDEFALQIAPISQTAEDAKRFMATAQGKASQTSVLLFGFIAVVSFIITLLSWIAGW